MIYSLVGLTGAIISFVLWIPQARLVWLNRNNPAALRGVSMTTQAMAMVNAVLWGVYAVGTGAYWPAASGLVIFPVAGMTIIVARRGLASWKSEPSGTPTYAPAATCACQHADPTSNDRLAVEVASA